MKRLICLLTWAGMALPIRPAVINVPEDQPTIQAGIDAADNGDTVLVAWGVYVENVLVYKPVHLVGQAVNATVIDGSSVGDVVHITASGVTIHGFSIVHGGADKPSEDAWDAAVKITYADSCVIERCRLCDNLAAGVSLAVSSHNTITQCAIHDNYVGIYFYEPWSRPYQYNSDNSILRCHVSDNSSTGIRFEHTGSLHHASNLIRRNYIANNGSGVLMIMSHENEVSYNNFNGNFGLAAALSMCMGGGDLNQIHHNSFISNNGGQPQAFDGNDYLGTNYWFSLVLQEGNYWSDYTGSDSDSDGIGDVPYDIPGSNFSEDLYPLMQGQDSDGDSLIDSVDNCAEQFNSDQSDRDVDFVGDSCDECTDYDNDGFGDPGFPANTCDVDNCPDIYNPEQTDTNGDGVGDACECCTGIRGNVDGDPAELVNIVDLTFLVSYLFGGGEAPACPPEANVDGDGQHRINIVDLTYLVAYLFDGGAEPAPCPRLLSPTG